MALAKRLIIETSDINGNNTTIHVWLEAYAGAAVTREGSGNPLEISFGKKSGEQLPTIYGSSATIEFKVEDGDDFTDLFTANAKDIFVEVLKNDTDPIFKGFIEPEKWNEQLIDPPYFVSFTAFDGLGPLKDEPFAQADGTPYEGTMTLLQILSTILQKTGLQININTAVNIRENTQLSTSDALIQVKKDVVTYTGDDCYKVLEQLFTGCRIFQRAGEWHILSNDNWGKTNIATYRYNYTGNSIGTGTITPRTAQPWWIEDVAEYDMMPALKQFTIKQDYGLKDNLLTNGDFSELTGNNIAGWTSVGVTPEVRTLEDDEKYIFLPGIQMTEHYNGITNGIYQRFNIDEYDPSSFLKVSLKYACMGEFKKAARMFLRVRLITDTNQYWYLFLSAQSTSGNPVYTWITGGNNIVIPLEWPDWERAHKVAAYPYSEITDKFKSWTAVSSQGLPAAGTLELMLYVPYSSETRIDGSCWSNPKITFVDENENNLATDRELVLINNSKNNYVADDLELANGDMPDVPNKATIYEGGFLLADGTPTESWKIDGLSGVYTYAELIARLLASSMRQPRQAYNIKLADMLPGTDMVIVDTTNNNKILVEAGITYNDRMQTTEGRYIEILADDVQNFTVGETINYKKSNSSGSTSGGGTVNTDETVKLINREAYEISSEAGYLNDRYFEIETDEESGRRAIKTRDRLLNRNYIIDELNPTTDPLATGNNSIALGEGTTAEVYRMLALGSFNEAATGQADSWVATDPLLAIGNGTDDGNKSTALLMYKSGYTFLDNALRLGAFDWGANDPESGALQYTTEDGFQAYANSAWNNLLFIDAEAEDTKVSYYDAASLAIKTSAVVYSDLETHLADIATYSAINIDAETGQVIDTFASDAKGHVTGIALRSLVMADIPDLSSLYADVNHNHDSDYATLSHNHNSSYIRFGGTSGQVWVSNGVGGGEWDTLVYDRYIGWDLYVDGLSKTYITSGYNLNFAGAGGIGVSYAGGTVTIDGSAIVGGYTLWSLLVNGSGGVAIHDTDYVNLIAGSNISIVKSDDGSGYGTNVTINATGGTSYIGGTLIGISGSYIDVDITEASIVAPSTSDYLLFHDTSLNAPGRATISNILALGGSSYTEGQGIDITSGVISLDIDSISTQLYGSQVASTDKLCISDSGTEKYITASEIARYVLEYRKLGTVSIDSNWAITANGTNLYIMYGGVAKATITSAGSVQALEIKDL